MSEPQRSTGEEVAAACAAIANAIGEVMGRFIEQARPLLTAMAKLAADPALRAELARREARRGIRTSGCHCLCTVSHPGDGGTCDGDSVTTVRRWSNVTGHVDVPMCAPCAAAQMRGVSR